MECKFVVVSSLIVAKQMDHHYDQEALVSLWLDALLLDGHNYVFIVMCRHIHSGTLQGLHCCGFARMAQEGRVV